MTPADPAPGPTPVGDGLILVDKPAGWTSHDVVARMRRLAHTRKVGHAGTLDPMATGVLVLGVNKGTKLLTFLVGADKDYAATIRLGQSTVTDDAEGEVTASLGVSDLDPERISSAVTALTGDIKQVPSTVSAIKIDGQRAYAMARAGREVTLSPRPVTVRRFEVLEHRVADSGGLRVLDLDVLVTVSSGTYVRALARDLGDSLGVGGHLTALRRTRVGGLEEDAAHTLDSLGELAERGAALPVLTLAEVARRSFPVRELTEEEVRALSFGARIEPAEPGRAEPVAGVAPDGRLIAMLDESGTRTRSHVVFAPASS